MASAMLSRGAIFVRVTAGLPSLSRAVVSSPGLRVNVVPAQLGRLKMRSGTLLKQARRSAALVSTKQDTDNTPLPKTTVDPEKKDDPLSVFDTSPISKFYRPELEQRLEACNTSTSSLMKFDGPAPKTINSRLAMLGITWAFVAEILIAGWSVWEQVTEGRSLVWFLFVVPIFIAASLIPKYNWESPDSRRNGPFNAQAER